MILLLVLCVLGFCSSARVIVSFSLCSRPVFDWITGVLSAAPLAGSKETRSLAERCSFRSCAEFFACLRGLHG